MKKTKDKAEKRAFEEGSGNVFADLGLDDADERFPRAKLGFHVYANGKLTRKPTSVSRITGKEFTVAPSSAPIYGACLKSLRP
jgi:hypothetical protein